MKAIAYALLALIAMTLFMALTGCAQTVFYRDGKPIARFQGDMTGTEYTMAADGTVKFKADTIDHSSATKAQGEAASGKINSAGAAIAASGLTLLLK